MRFMPTVWLEGEHKFSIWYAVMQLVGLLVVLMMLAWCVYFQGGMGWRWSPNEMNVHPFMMTLGFIYIMSNSIIIYRGAKNFSKLTLKQLHAGIHLTALICVIVGLVAVWDYKNFRGWTNLTSLHSWIGLITLIIFVLQWCYSLAVFLYPGAASSIRAKCMKPHVFAGLACFCLACVAAITGIFQQTLYSHTTKERTFGNCLGLFVCLYAAIFLFIITKSEFKRIDYHL